MVGSKEPQKRRDSLRAYALKRKKEGLPEATVRLMLEDYHINNFDMSYPTMNDDIDRVIRRIFG